MLLALCLGLLCLGACGKTAEESGAIVANGGDWQVELEGNPTTGYEWTWFLEGDEVIGEVSCEYIPHDTEGLWDGVGGRYVYHFVPKAEGEAVLHFEYARPWEDKEPVESWDIPLSVRQENGELVIYPPGT